MNIRFTILILVCLLIKIKHGESRVKNIEKRGNDRARNADDGKADNDDISQAKGDIKVPERDDGQTGNGRAPAGEILASTAVTPPDFMDNTDCSYTFKVSSMAMTGRCDAPKHDRRCGHKKIRTLQKDYANVSMNVLKLQEKINIMEVRLEMQSEIIAKLQKYAYTEECDRLTGWIRYNNSCYWFSPRDHQTSWMNSNIICKSLHESASLSVLNDEDEAMFVLAHADMIDRQSFWWIGCRKNPQVREWTCVDGLALGFTRWSNNRPSNYQNDRCLQLWNLPYLQFTDTQCNQKWSFVCEKKIDWLFN